MTCLVVILIVRVNIACLVRGLSLGSLALQLHVPLNFKRRLPRDDAFLGIGKPSLLTSFASAPEHAADDGQAASTIVGNVSIALWLAKTQSEEEGEEEDGKWKVGSRK